MEQDKLEVPFREKLKSIPGAFGVQLAEKPNYEVLRTEGYEGHTVEIREYEPLLEVTTHLAGLDEPSKEVAFKKLAKYIFGRNIAMTAPVFMKQVDANTDTQTMAFVLPAKIDAKTAPLPEDSDIHVEVVPAQTWAVIRYSGRNDLFDIEEMQRTLRGWLRSRGDSVAQEVMRFAQYDGPNTIPMLRRNEVQVLLWTEPLES